MFEKVGNSTASLCVQDGIMNHIDESLLDWEDDLLVYQGEPFTGTTFLQYKDGSQKREMSYESGLPSGWCKEWYELGSIKKEWFAVRSQGASEERCYYESGSLLSERLSEFNIETSFKKYSESGDLLENRLLAPSSQMYKVLERMRSVHA